VSAADSTARDPKHTLRRALSDAWRMPMSPVIPRWSRRRDDSNPTNRFYRRALEQLYTPGLVDAEVPRTTLVLATLLWPLTSTLRALKHTRRAGSALARAEGISRWRQLLRQIYLANAYNLPPAEYYHFGLHRQELDPANVVPQFELGLALQRLYRELDSGPVDDKIEFYVHCQRHSLPTPRIFAVCRAGTVTWQGDQQTLPPENLIFKPTNLSGGAGIEIWTHSNEAWSRRGSRLSAAELMAHLQELSERTDYLVQRRIENHPGVAQFSLGALCTVRVVTQRPPHGPAAPLCAGIRMPVGESEVDNFAAGGIWATLDCQRGTVTHHGLQHNNADFYDHHPDTKAQIRGAQLPLWPQLLELCNRGHDSYPDFAFVGWDVAITPDGPCLIEANTLWTVTPHCALGETDFVQTFLDHARSRGLSW
jgi:hypothetical protein